MFNSLKNAFLYRLIRVLDNHYERNHRLTESPWWKPNLCEPTVQLALRDVCRPGDLTFDVGANFGHLSVLMSRLVGPRGVVCSFEASPRNLAPLQMNLNWNGCGNARVVHAAVSTQSGSQVGFVYGSHPPADRLGTQDDTGPPDVMVSEMALDDFVEHFQLEPRVVKMDIEGAEFAALQGFARSLDRLRPILVLETAIDHREAVKFLLDRSYRVIDLSNYHELASETDFPSGVVVSNVLCFPKERPPAGYETPLSRSLLRTLKSSEFRRIGEHSLVTASAVELPSGRYVVEADFDASGEKEYFACGMREHGQTVVKNEGSPSWIRSSYRCWTWHCHQLSKLDFFFEFHVGQVDPTFKLNQVNIYRVANLQQSWMTTI